MEEGRGCPAGDHWSQRLGSPSARDPDWEAAGGKDGDWKVYSRAGLQHAVDEYGEREVIGGE